MITMQKKNITIKVQRLDPAVESEPKTETYIVPFSSGMSVSEAIQLINERYGAALAYLVACRKGICGTCSVKVNGKTRLACCTPVEGDFTVGPAFPNLVIKDLVTGKDA